MPSAEPTSPAVAAETLVPARLLLDGEVVILAIKPSGWFVVLVSLPVVAVAAGVAALAWLARAINLAVSVEAVGLFCLGVVALRLIVACAQWLGRLYVLTNLRVLRIRGVWRMDLFSCPLKQIRQPVLSFSRTERMLALGSLFFRADKTPPPEAGWINIARPLEIQQMVSEAIGRAK